MAIAAVVLWSTMPIALCLLLDRMDAVTITWYRFLIGAVVLGGILRWKGQLQPVAALFKVGQLRLLAVAAIGLNANFVLYLYALNFIPPGSSQIVMQLAPLFVLLGGVVLFREPFRPIQMGGLCLLVVGLLLFFNQRMGGFSGSMTNYSFGVLVVICAAALFSSYALAQKQLLRVCSSSGIMLVIYAAGVIMLLPFSTFVQISNLSTLQYGVLAYSSANALVAYGCFAEALQHWEASRISTIVCTTPLLTLALSYPASAIWPDRIMSDELNRLGLIGAALVVTGAMLAALGAQRKRGQGPSPSVRQKIGYVALVVPDYDEAIRFYVGVLGFRLVEDTVIEAQSKRWVLVAPPGALETMLLLARAVGNEQESRIGNQTGGRVFLFLHTDDFWRDLQAFKSRGVEFVREPQEESYGTVAVFKDPFGNLWDLLQLE